MTDEGFVRRWSQRKSAARAADQQAEPAPEVPAPEPAPEPGDAAVAKIDPATLPDIESLTYQSDYTAFLQKGVPSEVRNRALRRLWRSDPLLANLDGLVEYGEDYSKVGMVKEVVRTAYRVGRGMLSRIEAAEEERSAAAAARDRSAAAGGEPALIDVGAGENAVAGATDDGDAPAPVPQPPPTKADSEIA